MIDKYIKFENPQFRFGQVIAYSTDNDIRHLGSSGGVTSAIIKYLFETGKIGTAINFRFDQENLYQPELVYSYSEYEITGSIYHEINLYRFLKKNLEKIKSPIIVMALPCQVGQIRSLFERNNIEAYLMACTCSGQLSKDATYYLLEKLKIKKEDVQSLRYRGNGWPSGVQIKTAKQDYFLQNNDSIWFDLFHSQIFTLERCFHCTDTFGLKADITIADPWLKKYIENDQKGSSLVIMHTERALELITKMLENRDLEKIEDISIETALLSQRFTLEKKYIYLKHQKAVKFVLRVIRHKHYIYFMRILNLERFHRRVLNKIIKVIFKMFPKKRGVEHEAIIDKPAHIKSRR